MSDKGIIFSAPMVRALLDGRKTQTRRLLTPAPETFEVDGAECEVGLWHEPGKRGRIICGRCITLQTVPYAPGDRLYVREAWHVRGIYTDVVEVAYRASENRSHTEFVEQVPVALAIPGKGRWPQYPKWGPSIHMPRWASRMWLAVTEVRVERLQDISEADAIAEGIEPGRHPDTGEPEGWRDYETIHAGRHKGCDHPHAFVPYDNPWRSYASLWDELHTEPGTRWTDNPWVVAVSFDVNRGNIDGGAA